MFELEKEYWWFVARRHLLATTLKRLVATQGTHRILDLGAGTGGNQQVLEAFGQTFGCDISPTAVRYAQRNGVARLALCDLESLCYASESFDLITALDILEHLPDDLRGLSEIHAICRPGGYLVVMVPAYGFLWSEHDEALHHVRRYTAWELRNKMTLAGFEVVRSTYFITTFFFPILAYRILQNIFKRSVYPKTTYVRLPGWLNRLLVVMLRLEQFLLRWVNLPFGVSVLCVGQKRGHLQFRGVSERGHHSASSGTAVR